jgi:hypothetical protein
MRVITTFRGKPLSEHQAGLEQICMSVNDLFIVRDGQLAKLSIGNLRHRDDLLLVAAMNYHVPESAWDRTPPTSNAGMEAWSTRWAARCPFKLADWPLVKELLAKARGI